MATPRYASKFESSSGGVSLTFPKNAYEYESTQGLRSDRILAAGAHYPVRLLGTGRALKDVGKERLRFVFTGTGAAVDTAIDAFKQKVNAIGFGKLYTIGADASLRWAWAEVDAMPSLVVATQTSKIVTASISFIRLSDWYASSITNEGGAIAADPATLVITNGGLLVVRNAIITIRGTYTNPAVTNPANGYSFSSTRDGSAAAHYLIIDCGKGTVEFSTDSGTTKADDIANFTRGANQVGFMNLEPGDNSWSVTGCNGATIDVNFYGAYD